MSYFAPLRVTARHHNPGRSKVRTTTNLALPKDDRFDPMRTLLDGACSLAIALGSENKA